MSKNNSTKKTQILSNNDISRLETCCADTPFYEITYKNIQRKWLVCISCSDIDCFKTGIKQKTRILT
jgi:hypothetical protein